MTMSQWLNPFNANGEALVPAAPNRHLFALLRNCADREATLCLSALQDHQTIRWYDEREPVGSAQSEGKAQADGFAGEDAQGEASAETVDANARGRDAMRLPSLRTPSQSRCRRQASPSPALASRSGRQLLEPTRYTRHQHKRPRQLHVL